MFPHLKCTAMAIFNVTYFISAEMDGITRNFWRGGGLDFKIFRQMGVVIRAWPRYSLI